MSISEFFSNLVKNDSLTCHFCHAEEGKVHKVGKFVVSMRTITYESKSIHVCQSCERKVKLHPPLLDYVRSTRSILKRLLSFLVPVACCITSIIGITVLLHTVGLSAHHEQALIGGFVFGIPATVGAYSIKKIKKRLKKNAKIRRKRALKNIDTKIYY